MKVMKEMNNNKIILNHSRFSPKLFVYNTKFLLNIENG